MSLWGPALIEQLAGQHQLLLFDNRGAGLSSDTAQNNTTIPQMAYDGAGLIQRLDRIKAAVAAGTMPNDFTIPKQTILCFRRSRHSPTPERGPAVAQTLQPMVRRIDGEPLHGRHRHRAG